MAANIEFVRSDGRLRRRGDDLRGGVGHRHEGWWGAAVLSCEAVVSRRALSTLGRVTATCVVAAAGMAAVDSDSCDSRPFQYTLCLSPPAARSVVVDSRSLEISKETLP